MVDDSEREDFEQAIRDKGFESDDFELIEKQSFLAGGEIYAVTGTIIIKRKSSGFEKSYQAGHGSAWSAEFNDDLAKGAFE